MKVEFLLLIIFGTLLIFLAFILPLFLFIYDSIIDFIERKKESKK